MSLARTIVGAAVVALGLTPTSALAVTPTPVATSANAEFRSSGNADYVAWTFTTRRAPRTDRIRVRPTVGAAYTLNDRGRWFSGDMDQTGSLLPYYRWVQGANRASSDIHLYDMSTRRRATVPPKVNTTRLLEYFPALSGNQLTFVRRGRERETLWLVTDRSTGAKVEVKTVDLSRAFFANAPNLIGNWVTYAICRRSGCEAYRYDIGLATIVAVPNPLDRFYFAPAADIAGNVYVERSGARCGSNARLMKWTGSGDPSIFYSFARGQDMTGTSVFDDGTDVTLYTDTYGCADRDQDIVSFLNP